MGKRMHLGITATRDGLTIAQLGWIVGFAKRLIIRYPDSTFHHGDCIGGDEEAFTIFKNAGYRTHVHPPNDSKYRAFTKNDVSEKTYEYLVRNEHIVQASELMIVAPNDMTERKRSGTWATWRYAKRLYQERLPWVIVFPDGTLLGNKAWEVWSSR